VSEGVMAGCTRSTWKTHSDQAGCYSRNYSSAPTPNPKTRGSTIPAALLLAGSSSPTCPSTWEVACHRQPVAPRRVGRGRDLAPSEGSAVILV
jgi:hypothetical protein